MTDTDPRMDGEPTASGARDRRRGHRLPALPLELRQEVVEYPDRPDRVTVSPSDASGLDRMATWLTVDRAVMVDLETVR